MSSATQPGLIILSTKVHSSLCRGGHFQSATHLNIPPSFLLTSALMSTTPSCLTGLTLRNSSSTPHSFHLILYSFYIPWTYLKLRKQAACMWCVMPRLWTIFTCHLTLVIGNFLWTIHWWHVAYGPWMFKFFSFVYQYLRLYPVLKIGVKNVNYFWRFLWK